MEEEKKRISLEEIERILDGCMIFTGLSKGVKGLNKNVIIHNSAILLVKERILSYGEEDNG